MVNEQTLPGPRWWKRSWVFDLGEIMAERKELSYFQKIIFSLLPVVLAVVINGATVAYVQGQNATRMDYLETQQHLEMQRVTELEKAILDLRVAIPVRDEQFKEVLRRLDQIDSRLTERKR